MLRSPHRFVSFVLLLSTLIGLLPATGPARMASAAPLAMVSLDPEPPMSPPADAHSSGFPAGDVDDLIDDYENRHTASGQAFTMFDQARKVTFEPLPVEHTGSGLLRHRLTIPPGPHTSIEMDISVASPPGYQAAAKVYVLDHTNTWQEALPGALVDTNTANPNSKHVHLALGSTIDRSAPLQIDLACYPSNYIAYPDRKATCKWSSIKIYDAVPGWLPYQAKAASSIVVSSVYDSTYAGINPVNGPFLVMESTHTGSGGNANQVHKIQSELLQFPSVTGPISVNLKWAMSLTTGSSTLADGIHLYFIPADGGLAEKLLETDVSGSIGWQDKSATFGTTSTIWQKLSGKQGRLDLRISSGGTPRAVGIDNITFLHNGQPLTLLRPNAPADQSVGHDHYV